MAAGRDTKAMQPPPLELTRVLHAPRKTVFAAWSSSDHIRRWFCPEGFTVPQATVETHVGGRFEVCMRSPAGQESWSRGTFVEVVPNSRLVLDTEVADQDGKRLFTARTTVDFADALGGTRIDIVQTYTLIDPEAVRMVAGAPEGWRTTLDKLEREVMRMQGGPDAGPRSVAHGSFRLERSYDAPVAWVWRALTDQNAKAKWFGPPPGECEILDRQMDVRVGGRERLTGRWASGVVSSFEAVYHDVVPNERLVYAYVMHLDARKISVSLATLELSAGGGGTRLVVTEQGAFLDGYDDAGSREHGTGILLDRLGAALAEEVAPAPAKA